MPFVEERVRISKSLWGFTGKSEHIKAKLHLNKMVVVVWNVLFETSKSQSLEKIKEIVEKQDLFQTLFMINFKDPIILQKSKLSMPNKQGVIA